TQQLVVLHILQVSPVRASVVTGAAFAAGGLATTVASITYSRAVKPLGYRWVAVLAALVFGLSIAAVGLSASVVSILLAISCFGIAYGSLYPTLAAMLGLRAPREVQATVYGFNGSANAVGFGLGPLVGGTVAAATEVPVALLVTAGVAIGLSLFLAALVREPRTASQ